MQVLYFPFSNLTLHDWLCLWKVSLAHTDTSEGNTSNKPSRWGCYRGSGVIFFLPEPASCAIQIAPCLPGPKGKGGGGKWPLNIISVLNQFMFKWTHICLYSNQGEQPRSRFPTLTNVNVPLCKWHINTAGICIATAASFIFFDIAVWGQGWKIDTTTRRCGPWLRNVIKSRYDWNPFPESSYLFTAEFVSSAQDEMIEAKPLVSKIHLEVDVATR